jgi:hypothetical protein
MKKKELKSMSKRLQIFSRLNFGNYLICPVELKSMNGKEKLWLPLSYSVELLHSGMAFHVLI